MPEESFVLGDIGVGEELSAGAVEEGLKGLVSAGFRDGGIESVVEDGEDILD